MHTKVVELGSWDGPGMDVPSRMIKVSSRGLIGNDRVDFLKTASHVFADAIDNIKLADGDIPIHLNAIGATEAYGANRNGDAFNEHTCKTAHNTFVKHARYYANHKNKDPEKSYGIIKLSAYNDRMRRIELLLLGSGNKSAADRNGGLVMKAASIDKLSRGESLPFSMACRIAHDVCSNCFNKAANRSQYCSEDTCISPTTGRRGFGCKTGLSKVASDGFQQFVENPDPRFFDMSEVIRPADRIAYGAVADYMQKAASHGQGIGGAELAEIWAKQGADFDLLSPEDEVFHKNITIQLKVARDLAEIERQVESNRSQRDEAFARGINPHTDLDVSGMGAPGSTKLATSLSALAEQKIALPLTAFLHLATGGDREKIAAYSDTVPRHLPGIFGRLTSDAGLEAALKSNPFAFSCGQVPCSQSAWAIKQAEACSLDPEAVRNRVFRSAIQKTPAPGFLTKESMIKTAAADEPSEKLARQYAMYKVAFLASLPQDPDFSTISRFVVCQNYVQK